MNLRKNHIDAHSFPVDRKGNPHSLYNADEVGVIENFVGIAGQGGAIGDGTSTRFEVEFMKRRQIFEGATHDMEGRPLAELVGQYVVLEADRGKNLGFARVVAKKA